MHTAEKLEGDQAWRQCETAWSTWLQANGHMVAPQFAAVGNAPRTKAPLLFKGRAFRAPDLIATKLGKSEYWEVKYRSRADRDPLSGTSQHWMDFDSLADYVQVARESRSTVWIILYEEGNALRKGRWLRMDVEDALVKGSKTQKFGHDGAPINAWVWPVSAMEVVQGPDITVPTESRPIMPNDSGITPPPPSAYKRGVLISSDGISSHLSQITS